MLDPAKYFDYVKSLGINFFTGVPDHCLNLSVDISMM